MMCVSRLVRFLYFTTTQQWRTCDVLAAYIFASQYANWHTLYVVVLLMLHLRVVKYMMFDQTREIATHHWSVYVIVASIDIGNITIGCVCVVTTTCVKFRFLTAHYSKSFRI